MTTTKLHHGPAKVSALMFVVTALFLSGISAGARGATTAGVTAAVDRTDLSLGETVTLEIVMSGEFDQAKGPEMPDFQVVGRSSGSSISIINGQVSRQQKTTVSIAPTKPGKLTIGKIELLKDGRVIASSPPIKITVRDGEGEPPPAQAPSGQQPGMPSYGNQGPDPADQVTDEPEQTDPVSPAMSVPQKYADKSAFLLARIPDRPMYAGEPVFLEYVLFVKAGIPLSGLRLQGAPTLKGFIVENPSEESDSATPVMIGNQRYEARVLWRSAITAIDPGKAVIDPMKIELYVGDVFGRRKYVLTSDPIALKFLEIPAEGRPADFIPGTIGTFIIKATLDKETVNVGESAILTIEVAGSGNLRAVKPPKIAELDGLRIDRVASSDLDELKVDRGGISGRKVFQYLLTPRKEGSFDVGRIDVPFFNNLSGAFERARSEKITLTVAGFANGGPVMEVRSKAPTLGIIGQSSLEQPSVDENRGVSATALALAMIAPVLMFAAFEAAYRRKLFVTTNAPSIAGRRALKNALFDMKHLEHQPLQGQDFWNEADAIIRGFLEARFAVNAASMTPGELAAALNAAGVEIHVAQQMLDELESCAFARFAPPQTMDDDRAAAIVRIRQCLSTLDKTRGGAKT